MCNTKESYINQRIRTSILPILYLLLVGIVSVAYAPALWATDLTIQGGVNAAHGDGQPTDLFGGSGVFSMITDTLLFIVGALSVIMIIIGGLRYVTSGGNPTSVTAAKNTILYAIVGLVVAFLAYAAINFVLESLTTGGVAGTDV